jgi:hypothetical protein
MAPPRLRTAWSTLRATNFPPALPVAPTRGAILELCQHARSADSTRCPIQRDGIACLLKRKPCSAGLSYSIGYWSPHRRPRHACRSASRCRSQSPIAIRLWSVLYRMLHSALTVEPRTSLYHTDTARVRPKLRDGTPAAIRNAELRTNGRTHSPERNRR